MVKMMEPRVALKARGFANEELDAPIIYPDVRRVIIRYDGRRNGNSPAAVVRYKGIGSPRAAM